MSQKVSKGVIYILTNPSFQDYVKIGYADDIDQRLAQLNRSECTPFAFRVYATYEVNVRLSDMKIHSMIDRLNPSLRAIDTVNGKKRIREFYAMTAEDAYLMFEAMAEIHGTTDRLHRIKPTKEQASEEELAKDIRAVASEKAAPFSFTLVKIPVGAEIEFYCKDNPHSGEKAYVVDSKHVTYGGETYTLSALAKILIGTKSAVAGPRFFRYRGEILAERRQRMENT